MSVFGKRFSPCPRRRGGPAIDGGGQPRDGAWGAELTGHLTLDAWPEGSRLIVRRERPHPGDQLSFTDVDGHRFQCVITDQLDYDLAAVEARHRAHAIVEYRARELKSMGLGNLPFSAFAPNQAWLEAALVAHDLTVWTQLLLFDGEHAYASPNACATGCARGRQAHPPRPPADPAPARRLALGRRRREGVQAPRRAARLSAGHTHLDKPDSTRRHVAG